MTARSRPGRGRFFSLGLLGLSALIAGLLSVADLAGRLPVDLWAQAIFHPDRDDMSQVIVHYTWLPRIAVACICGAALAIAGAAMQQVLRNPLAEPTTLGTAAGAQLALLAALVWAPATLSHGREWVAFAGGAAATTLVFALAWGNGLAPLTATLAGMIVSLFCGALGTALIILNSQYLPGFFLWGSGSLTQEDWSPFLFVAPRVAVAGALLLLTIRALSVLDVGDSAARGLGLSLRWTRLGVLTLAVVLATTVTSAVGIIAFLGLAAPALARLGGARTLRDRFVWSPVVGAVLLWLTDEVAKRLGRSEDALPAGAVTALLGAPIILWLVPRVRSVIDPATLRTKLRAFHARHPWAIVGAIGLLCVTVFAATLFFGRVPSGWHIAAVDQIGPLLRWRLPRVAAAFGVGILLALAGCVLQRLTGNPLAAPDVLGVTTGAALATIGLLYALPTAGRGMQIVASTVGACTVLFAVLWLGRRSGYAPQRMLLAGIALGALFDGVIVTLMATDLGAGLGRLLDWLAGSLYHVDGTEAAVVCIGALVALAIAPFGVRWLDILPLGAPCAMSLGVDLRRARVLLLLFSAAASGLATVIVGPLGFVGLMAPHMARLTGLRGARQQLAGAALLGGATMMLADWAGRNVIFPFQLPAGIVAAVIGAPYLLAALGAQSGFRIRVPSFARRSALSQHATEPSSLA